MRRRNTQKKIHNRDAQQRNVEDQRNRKMHRNENQCATIKQTQVYKV